MSAISQDLREAEQELKKMLTWGQVVRTLSKQNHEAEKDTARWLLLKEADTTLETYIINPYIPTMTWCEDKSIAKKILNSYLNIENEYVALVRTLKGQSKPAYWSYGVYIHELNDFLAQKNIPEVLTPTTQAIEVEPTKELTKPQQREIELLKYLQGDNGYSDITKLPAQAKKDARAALIALNPKLFTESTFDKVWAGLSARGTISLADKKKYISQNTQ